MINLTSLINQRIRAKLKARSEAKATTGRAISAAAKADPVVYAQEVFGLTVWSKQRDVLWAARDFDRVSVRSGHKVSKSTSAAVICWWFTSDDSARAEARAIISAPTGRQVAEIVWREITALHTRATKRGYRLPVPGKRPGTGVRWGDGREIVGFTIDEGQPEAIAGFSGSNLLFVLDEASGIADPVFEALDGNAAAGARFFLISNPTRTSGAFFDSQQARSDYKALHISSEDSPNITGEAHIPGLAMPAWRDRMYAKYGRDSIVCAVRVRGEFPSGADDEVLGAELVRRAVESAAEASGPLVFGLDVAGFGGDDSVIAPRRGQRVMPLLVLTPGDSLSIAAQTIRAARRLRRGTSERVRVHVDANGVGAGVYAVLVSDAFEFEGERFEPREEVEAVAVNTGEAALDAATYANLRAELHFNARDWIREGGALPDDEMLDEELRAPRYSLDRINRILVEPKLKLRSRLGRSPDRSDAVLLSLLEIGEADAGAYRGGKRR